MFKESLPKSVIDFMEKINKKATDHPEWLELFNNSFLDTLQNTVKILEDETTFVLTGDIPAIWLRDSTAQVRPYLFLANDSKEIRSLITGVIERHFQLIIKDAYANAFNETENGRGHQEDQTTMHPIVWERKYEIDSLCYPIQLAYLYFKETGDTSHFNDTFKEGVLNILRVWETEQNHENSSYYFKRDVSKEEWHEMDTLPNEGKGSATGYTGMTWSGFRPSDDRCTYHYLVPSNMFAVVVLKYLHEIYTEVIKDKRTSERILILKNDIDRGIQEHAKVKNKEGKDIYAYEVDGLGNALIMDDANIPSLLSAPYLGYVRAEDPIYQETRETILSEENPYFYQGKAAAGIGSPHTPPDYIWHMSIAMEGLTSFEKEKKKDMLNKMIETNGEKKALHEGFHKDRPEEYTREWFSWPNMLFCELMLDYFGFKLKGAEM